MRHVHSRKLSASPNRTAPFQISVGTLGKNPLHPSSQPPSAQSPLSVKSMVQFQVWRFKMERARAKNHIPLVSTTWTSLLLLGMQTLWFPDGTRLALAPKSNLNSKNTTRCGTNETMPIHSVQFRDLRHKTGSCS